MNTPNCFPTNKPNTIPSGTLSKREFKDRPSSDTPAFANANKGIIPKATYGLIACSTLINKEKSFSFFLCGIVIAKRTPAIVAWIPELWVKSQRKIPMTKYGKNFLILNLLITNNKRKDNNINDKYFILKSPE